MELLNLREGAKELRLSIHTIRSWVYQRKIPYVRMGRRILLRREDLENLVIENVSEAGNGGLVKSKITLRHVGILVKDLEEARKTYETLGFKQFCPIEHLKVLKMADENGAIIELVQGNWPEHIAVNWYSDGQGNRIEVVESE